MHYLPAVPRGCSAGSPGGSGVGRPFDGSGRDAKDMEAIGDIPRHHGAGTDHRARAHPPLFEYKRTHSDRRPRSHCDLRGDVGTGRECTKIADLAVVPEEDAAIDDHVPADPAMGRQDRAAADYSPFADDAASGYTRRGMDDGCERKAERCRLLDHGLSGSATERANEGVGGCQGCGIGQGEHATPRNLTPPLRLFPRVHKAFQRKIARVLDEIGYLLGKGARTEDQHGKGIRAGPTHQACRRSVRFGRPLRADTALQANAIELVSGPEVATPNKILPRHTDHRQENEEAFDEHAVSQAQPDPI